MRKNIKLPTILGIFILLSGLFVGIYAVNSRQIFKISAGANAAPKNVRISNISDSSVTITWTTDIESIGFIKWGLSQNFIKNVTSEENSIKSYVHSVKLTNVTNNSEVFFDINSNGKDYINENISWQTKTLSKKLTINNPLKASGTVVMQDNRTAAKSLVYINVNSTILSGITSDEGTFVIPFSNFIETTTDNNPLEISVNAGLNGVSQAVIYPSSIESIPTIVLGKTYDFRSISEKKDTDIPLSKLSLPTTTEVSSRFEVQKLSDSLSTPLSEVKIESFKNGEIITTTNPNFFGTGPTDTSIEIKVESELQESTLIIGSNGKWNWSPPSKLEAGEHTLTASWKDTSGILRTITRNFIVNASEGPAFESTPSATPIKTIATVAPPFVEPVLTPKVTMPPTPETGTLTPTIGLFIMGIGVLMSSIFIWNKSNA